MARRGLVAVHPFSGMPAASYDAPNEERFRSQVVQQTADVYARLSNLEELLAAALKRIEVLEGGAP